MSGQVHLLVLIHGMWGNPGHLAEAARIFDENRVRPSKQDANGVQLRVLLAETNREDSTYDGIDWGGERIAQEVFDEMDKVKKEGGEVTRFSVMGYSLGGLVARYVIGIMHQKHIFDSVRPVNFNTIATPHIGMLRYPTMFSRLANAVGPTLLSRTGEQFFGVDKWSQRGRPLLEVMADPDRVFYQGLTLFEHVRIYANTVNDLTVPYITAAIEFDDPFAEYKTTGLDVELKEDYAPLIKSWSIPPVPPPREPKPILFSPSWFRSYSIPLPPRLQRGFPLNVIIVALLPILFPTFITLAITRLALSSRSSRERIKLLEKGDMPRLLSIIAELEREIEGIVLDDVENTAGEPHGTLNNATESTQLSALSPTPSSPAASEPATPPSLSASQSKSAPRLSPMQRRIIASLNALPQLRKELVWIPNVRNSHATIIARDVANFPFHELGQGVLRHWADCFIL